MPSNLTFNIPGIEKFYVNQICVAKIVEGSVFDIYVSKIDFSDKGGSPAKPMVLSYMRDGSIVDNTIKVFANNIPDIFFGRAVASIDLNEDGLSDIYVGDHGQDTGKFPGGQNFVLLSTASNTLVKDLFGIPTYPTGLNHGFGYGDVDGSGHISVINNGFRYSFQPAVELLVNSGTSFIHSPNKLPPFLIQTGTVGYTYGWANLVDVNDDGRSDLLFGEWDQSKTNSLLLMNDGKGDFSKSSNSYLPIPDMNIRSPNVVQLTPVDIFRRGVNDLVLSITEGGPVSKQGGYSVKYLQFLKNDGNGNFADITNSVFPQTVIHGDVDWYSFVKPVDINCDGYQDLLVQTSTTNSFLLMNDTKGHFYKGQVFDGAVSVDICFPETNGIPHVISTNNKSVNWMPPSNAPIASGITIYSNDLPLGKFRYFDGHLNSNNVIGTEFNDVFIPGYGREVFNGSSGLDEVRLSGVISDYSININSDLLKIQHKTNSQISVEAYSTERISFANSNFAFDFKGNAGAAVKVLGAVFGKSAVANKEYVGIGLYLLDEGMSYEALAGLALGAVKATTNDQIITTLWSNVVGSIPSASDKAPFIKLLEDGLTPGTLAIMAAETSFNATNINLVGLAQTGIEYLPFG
jgi:hypothetical protein